MKLAIFLSFSVCLASAARIPQGSLSEDGFRISRAEQTPNNKVAVSSGYAQIRRQGRTLGGEVFQFKSPLTVRNPLEFAAASSGRGSNSIRPIGRKFTRLDMGPVFSLENMLRKEAAKRKAKVETAKLKAKIEEASLKAVHAAEEARKELEKLGEEAAKDIAELEATIDEAAAPGIEEIAKTIEDKLEEEKNQATENSSDVKFKDSIKNSEEPSSDIDLGSVQEV